MPEIANNSLGADELLKSLTPMAPSDELPHANTFLVTSIAIEWLRPVEI